MIRLPPRSTLDRSSAASDVYKRQVVHRGGVEILARLECRQGAGQQIDGLDLVQAAVPVSYTHLRAHETVLDLVCRLLLEQKAVNGAGVVVLASW